MPTAVPPPDLKIPHSEHTVDVSILNTALVGGIPSAAFMEPIIPGHEETGDVPAYSFSIKHSNPAAASKYDHVIFDLAVRKDLLENSPPAIAEAMKAIQARIQVDKNVDEVLRENGDDISAIGGIIWSHHHFDHTGDPSAFPSTTDLIVGPGFKAGLLPGWPEDPKSSLDSSAWKGRNLREIDFEGEGHGLKIGSYNAFDFYGDGSFYLLDSPGHAIGHMCGLARVTANPPEFIIMGGDIAHHGGEFRPTQYLPLPEKIQPNPYLPPFSPKTTFCPGEIFEAVHPKHSSTEPFMGVSTTSPTHHNHVEAQASLDVYKEFDAHENILAIIAHDTTLLDIVDFYPKTANGWRKKGWKEQGRWRFLGHFDTAERKAKKH